MIISWKPPLDSGGVDVSNYIIEKRDINRDMWTTVTSASTKTNCKVGAPPRWILLLWYHESVGSLKFNDVGIFLSFRSLS